ncbi:hypothetical protein C8T65DRAFT_672302 [Cerioporus squamosus]|nr:hypothetical protein C8T65DRAFT_672302 [Cerioporus squamosus]
MSIPSIARVSIVVYGTPTFRRLYSDFGSVCANRTLAGRSDELKRGRPPCDRLGRATRYERQPAALSFCVPNGTPQISSWFGSLRRLEMAGSYDTVDWREFFSRIPQLQELHIDSNPPQGFFDTLHPRSLELEYIFFPALLKLLKSRDSAGISLAELHVHSCIRVHAAVEAREMGGEEDMDSGDSWSDSDEDMYTVEESDEEELDEEELAATIPVWVS